MLTTSIADIDVTITCNGSTFMNRLRERYRLFLASEPGDFAAHVQVVGRERPSALLDTGVVFRDGVLHFTAPGYDGFVNVDAGNAELVLSSAQPVEDIDYFLRVIYALLAFHAGGILFHAAGVVRDGQGYLFFGHSGSGKTTVARLSSEDVVLNDDLVLLLPDGERWHAYATPFWNPTQVRPTRRHAPAAGLFRLVQDTRVYLEEMRPGQAAAEIVSNVPVIPEDPRRAVVLLDRCRQLLHAVPAYRLHFLPDDSFWEMVAPAT